MKYWVYIEGNVPGAYSPDELARIPGFSMTTLVCPAEGDIQEKNWRYAGEFTDIAQMSRKRSSQPMAPLSAQNALAGSKNPNEALDLAEAKIFLHVKDLMREVEGARQSQDLLVSLQNQVEGLRRDLGQGLSEKTILEKKIAQMEKDLARLEREGRENVERLEATLKAREESLSEVKADLERMRSQADNTRIQLKEANEDLAIRNALVNRLSKDLSEKEKSLEKSLEIIRRLEGELKAISLSAETVGTQDVSAAHLSREVEDDIALPSLDSAPEILKSSRGSSLPSEISPNSSSPSLGVSSTASIAILQLKKLIRK